jgi:hypothetical protein
VRLLVSFHSYLTAGMKSNGAPAGMSGSRLMLS